MVIAIKHDNPPHLFVISTNGDNLVRACEGNRPPGAMVGSHFDRSVGYSDTVNFIYVLHIFVFGTRVLVCCIPGVEAPFSGSIAWMTLALGRGQCTFMQPAFRAH